jgi:molybdopterin-guanine dinucleotide biosynthesis protein A
MAGLVAGIFVGGVGKRMGGRAKGLLRAPAGPTLVDRLRAVLTSAGIVDIVLVGNHSAYEPLGLSRIEDHPPSIGPLGGLISLLERAAENDARALALACDMPFVSDSLVRRLLSRRDVPVHAPRRAGLWEPLCAVYQPDRVLEQARRRAIGRDHSLQALLNEVGAVEMPLGADEALALTDWDTPEDMLKPS